MVYGKLEKAYPDDTNAPNEFREVTTLLSKIRPSSSVPWDPGYVELGFADYSYAPGPSIKWPSNWPPLTSPLVRDLKGLVIQKVMIFPSEYLTELDAFLKKEPELGAVLIGNWKTSVGYRWPLPAEKSWTTWNQ
jgi:hypothetical protein